MSRKFQATDSFTGPQPLIIALEGPPGGGKTYSALRLATGISKIRGGVPYVIDTEAGRSAKYSGQFKFKHVSFEPPFRSDSFLEAIRFSVEAGAAAVIVDSMSDEHEGQGGQLEWHDEVLDQIAGQDHAARERKSQIAWATTKKARTTLCNGILRITTPLIMCFRAREKTKMVKNDKGKVEPTRLGFVPIAPPELVHCCDLVCLLPCRSDGVPHWRSDTAGEDFMLKLPAYLRSCIKDGQLDEATGEALARWANREISLPKSKPDVTDDELAVLIETGHARSEAGTQALGFWWSSLAPVERTAIGKDQLETWKKAAEDFDRARN